NVTHAEKIDLLGRACAMVFPIRWPEPFGLVMIEAMACGTPVVTTNWGAAPELVEDGVTGFRRDAEDDLVDVIGAVGSLDPAACRCDRDRRGVRGRNRSATARFERHVVVRDERPHRQRAPHEPVRPPAERLSP